MKIKKRIVSKSIKSSRNYKCLKLWCSGSRPCDRRSGANAREAGFLAFERILCSAGFHLKFLGFKSFEVWCQPQKSLKPPKNGIRQYRLGLFDWVQGLWLSVLSRRKASKTLIANWSKRGIQSLSECGWINLLYIHLWTNGWWRVVETRWKGTRKTKSCSEWWQMDISKWNKMK